MAKQLSKGLKTFICIICFIVGLAVGSIGNLIWSTPDSYEIPLKVDAEHNHVVTGQINTTTVKNSDLSIHFLELGNKYTGDCTLIKVGDTEMLIDAGSKASSIQHIKNYINTYCTDGILEYVVVTHAHEDHYAGFATNENTDSLFDIYEVKKIIDFGTGTNKTANFEDTKTNMFENYVRERNAEIANGATYLPVQDFFKPNPAERRFELKSGSNVYVEILYQKFYNEEAETENDYSVCLQIEYESKYYLFTGDLEAEGEESLVEENAQYGKNEGMLHEVELYKAGHHGSKTSSSETLMNVIKPNIVCVCCCAGSSEYTSKNANQFPTQEFVNNVYSANPNTKVYVTTLCIDYKANKFESFNGNIVVCATSGASETAVYCSNNTTELRETDWFKANRTLPAVS